MSSACLLAGIVLCCLCIQVARSDSAKVDINYYGGYPVCSDDDDCGPGQYWMPSFECDTSSSWDKGMRIFKDTIGKHVGNITMITLTVFGVFGCGDSPSPSTASSQVVHIYLQGALVADLPVFLATNCSCRNCANSLVYPNKYTGWNYNYGGDNTFQILSDASICLSSVNIIFSYLPYSTTLTSSTTSTTSYSLTSSTTTTNSTLPIDGHRSLVVVGAVMLSGMVFVNVCVVGGWYALKRKPESDTESGARQNEGVFSDKELHYDDIRLGERIGRGSFGEVYTAFWFQTRVAVKKMPPEMLRANASILDEFNREINLLRALRHPNILQFIGSCSIPPNVCLVTEYMPRGDLHQIIHDHTVQLHKTLMKSILIDVCRGINYLHSSNPVVIHRDLKSHNVLIGEHWNAKVADFGLSKIILSWEETSKYTPCGTPKWAAPEVLRNEIYTTKADVYSFAVILWELTTRQDPFPGMSAFELIVQVGKHGLRPGIVAESNPLGDLIRECWNDDPKQRPPFDRIIEILEAW